MSARRPQNQRVQHHSVQLHSIDVSQRQELTWLYDFVIAHHIAPEWALPTKEELLSSRYVHFRALAVLPQERAGQLVGVTSFEKKTPHLAGTQRTIIDPRFRGQGWGRLVSEAIEKEVWKAGFGKIQTSIYAHNHGMLLIKLKQGYTIEGFHPDHDGPGLHEYSLGKLKPSVRS